MERSVRWLDRCIEHHKNSGKADTQNLFAIVQGGLDTELRNQCLDAMIKRRSGVAGYAIGGLSGGEEKGISTKTSRVFIKSVNRHILEGVCPIQQSRTSPNRLLESNNVLRNYRKIVGGLCL